MVRLPARCICMLSITPVLITGTSINGLGFESARVIAKHANLVIITGYNEERCVSPSFAVIPLMANLKRDLFQQTEALTRHPAERISLRQHSPPHPRLVLNGQRPQGRRRGERVQGADSCALRLAFPLESKL